MVSASDGLRGYGPTEATGGQKVPAVYIAADGPAPRTMYVKTVR